MHNKMSWDTGEIVCIGYKGFKNAWLSKISSGEANITFANDAELARIPIIPALKAKTSNQVAAYTSSNVNTTYTVPPGKEMSFFLN